MLPHGRMLIIGDGDIPGLLAFAAAGDRARAPKASPHLAWLPFEDEPAAALYRRAAERQADVYGLSVVAAPSSRGSNTPSAATHLLLDAVDAASRHRADAVVWPTSAGPEVDLNRTAATLDRALLVERLAALDRTPVRVAAPYADLTDRQIADMVVDLDLPVWTCWWWELGSPDRPRIATPEAPDPIVRTAVAEFARWTTVLRAAGWTPRLAARSAAVPSGQSRRPAGPSAAATL